MAWVRIDDQAPRHRKMLKAGPAACWLWVCGIAHSQSQMTDGFISLDVLPMIGVAGATRCRKLADQLVVAGLFDRADGGYMVHDYLDMNPSRVTVLQKRAEDAERKRKGEERRTEDKRNPLGIHTESEAPRAGVPSHPIPSDLKDSAPPKKPADPRVKQFLEWFPQEYTRRRFGAVYLVAWERDAPLVKRMLKAVDEPKLRRLAQMLLSRHCNEPFIEETDRGIGILSVKFNWLSDRLAKWDAEHAEKAQAV